MAKCRYTKGGGRDPAVDIERWFDGESADPEPIKRHVAECASCSAHLAQLETVRKGVSALSRHEEIRDAQLPAFMTGIREGVERPVRWRGVWAFVSIAAAALIVAASVLFIITNGPRTVNAVESCSTELEGATVSSYASGNGVTTVWVNLAPDDIP